MRKECKLYETMYDDDYEPIPIVLLILLVFAIAISGVSWHVYCLVTSSVLFISIAIWYKWKKNKEASLIKLISSKKTWVGYHMVEYNQEPAFLNLCLAMNSEEKPHPVCQKCIIETIGLTKKLLQESKEKANLATKLGLYEQALGTRNQLTESLPYPIQMLLINRNTLSPSLVIQRLKKHVAPSAKLFLPNRNAYDQYEFNVSDLDVNIPLEGLRFLESLSKKGGRKHETNNKRKGATNRISIPQFFGNFPNSP